MYIALSYIITAIVAGLVGVVATVLAYKGAINVMSEREKRLSANNTNLASELMNARGRASHFQRQSEAWQHIAMRNKPVIQHSLN